MSENSLLTFRTISQFIYIYGIAEIKSRIASGLLKASDLPLRVSRFLLIQGERPDGSRDSVVQFNDEAKLELEVKAKRALAAGEGFTLADIHPEECFIKPPTRNGKPAAYYFCQSLFLDFVIFFDFQPNVPGISSEDFVTLKQAFPITRFAQAVQFATTVKPSERLKELAAANWPPAPGYFPQVLLAVFQKPGSQNDPAFVDVVEKSYGTEYWKEQLKFWKETNFFPRRSQYIEKVVAAHYDGDYLSSIYVLVPHFEGIITDYLTSCGVNPSAAFKDRVGQFKQLVLSRELLMFPTSILDAIFDFVENGSFWKSTRKVNDPSGEVNRHGIAHGVFTEFETKAISLKYLVLLDALAFVILHDKIVTGKI